MRMLENRIPPPVVFLLTGLVMWLAARRLPHLSVDASVGAFAVGLLSLFALICGVSAVIAFRRARTTIDPVRIEAASSLVTSGIFRVTRNPMYLALTLLLLALSVHLATPWAMLGPALFVLYITRFQILPEEGVMRQKFGSAYAEYCERVRRWI